MSLPWNHWTLYRIHVGLQKDLDVAKKNLCCWDFWCCSDRCFTKNLCCIDCGVAKHVLQRFWCCKKDVLEISILKKSRVAKVSVLCLQPRVRVNYRPVHAVCGRVIDMLWCHGIMTRVWPQSRRVIYAWSVPLTQADTSGKSTFIGTWREWCFLTLRWRARIIFHNGYL